MPTSLLVRNLDEALVEQLKRRAALNRRSTEAEHREILQNALKPNRDPEWDELAARIRALTPAGHQTPSEVLQREGRDER